MKGDVQKRNSNRNDQKHKSLSRKTSTNPPVYLLHCRAYPLIPPYYTETALIWHLLFPAGWDIFVYKNTSLYGYLIEAHKIRTLSARNRCAEYEILDS